MRTKWVILSGLLTAAIASTCLGMAGVAYFSATVNWPRVAKEVAAPPKAKQSTAKAKFPMVRADFEAMLMHKTKDEIKAIIGPPSRTEGNSSKVNNPTGLIWSYQGCNLTTDPDNNRIDGQSNITLHVFGIDGSGGDVNWRAADFGYYH
jgi:hypothetical protein